jgi:hypothetical protein
MSNPTSNFNWQMPTASDLVTDLPADFETFGQAVDTSLADLKGGTTGQVLSKASNTDMDFSWVAADDTNAIQNSIINAKGDLIAGSANDTPAILTAGNNGETLVADSSTSTGLRYTSLFGANKNKLFNGDFYVNQRAFTTGNTDGVYGFDRWRMNLSGGTATYTAETFTAGAAPVAGYEGKNYAKVTVTTGNDFLGLLQRVEDVRNFANQTITISFWAKGVNPTTNNGLNVWLVQSFGTGGSPSANVVTESSKITLTASWARYSVTINVPSISGKTLGTNNDSYLQVSIGQASNASTDSWTLEVWGVQAEAGSVATAFQTATGTLQGELAACQRYFARYNADGGYCPYAMAETSSATVAFAVLPYVVPMRVTPASTFTAASTFALGAAGSNFTATAIAGSTGSTKALQIQVTVASGMTAGRAARLTDFSGAANGSYIDLSAEL